MTLQDQRFWLSAISAVASNMVFLAGWTLLAEQIRGYQPKGVVIQQRKPTQNILGSFQLHPPETNPPENRGFSIPRIRRWGQRHMNYGKSTQTDPVYYNYNYQRGNNARERSIRYINTNMTMQSEERGRQSAENKYNMQSDQTNGNTLNGERNKRPVDSLRCYVADNGVKAVMNPIQNLDRASGLKQRSQATNEATQNSRYFTSLAAVFGWNKAKAICEKHPNINNVCVLAQLLLEEDEQTMTETGSVESSRENQQVLFMQGDITSGTGVGIAESSTIERNISDQQQTPRVLNANQIQEETCSEVRIAASASNTSLDLISFAVPLHTPPQVDDHGNDNVLCDSCPDLIEL
ncbi:unnamed protein product [Toxocara canis]|uniref:UBA domain-containing protein n=1 Tax=Toxocara canis TaxID=6265 RepID=A0A183VEZ9_TOXCA|nr:unnamed protein product [Toxocara canis]